MTMSTYTTPRERQATAPAAATAPGTDSDRKAYSHHTFTLAKIFLGLKDVESRCHTLAAMPDIKHGSKHLINGIANRCTAGIRDFKSRLTPESMRIVESEILPTEIKDQMESINDMLLAMPKGIRDQVENHIAGLYNVYALNK
jgi:hypothetical protein